MNTKLYQEKLALARGNNSSNQFAEIAGISSGNFWRMQQGQIAKPSTLEKVAAARPDIEFLYEELMYAAGYSTIIPDSLKSQTHGEKEHRDLFEVIPIVTSLLGSKNKIINNIDNETWLFPQKQLEKGRYFFFRNNDSGLEPHIGKNDLILFDGDKIPKDGDIVLFRIEKKVGLVRYYRQINTKIIAYGVNPLFPPDYFNKNNVDILGVAVKAVVDL
ncbi:MAG: S24 family peptidase [Clostridiales bacterium]